MAASLNEQEVTDVSVAGLEAGVNYRFDEARGLNLSLGVGEGCLEVVGVAPVTPAPEADVGPLLALRIDFDDRTAIILVLEQLANAGDAGIVQVRRRTEERASDSPSYSKVTLHHLDSEDRTTSTTTIDSRGPGGGTGSKDPRPMKPKLPRPLRPLTRSGTRRDRRPSS